MNKLPIETGKNVSENLSWNIVVPEPGHRTNSLISSEPNIGRLSSVKFYEHIVPGSETGLLLFPGGLDRGTDDTAISIGQSRRCSVVHIKYPKDSSFSIRREVSQSLDEIDRLGLKNIKLTTGSWGGIPAFNALYQLVQENKVIVDSFFAIAPALQPSDFTMQFRATIGNIAKLAMESKKAFAMRQKLARFSNSVPNFEYNDPEVLLKIAEIPTVIVLPPESGDWLINSTESIKKYFPKASVVVCPAYRNLVEKALTFGGHNTTLVKQSLHGIDNLSKFLLDNPSISPPIPSPLPDGFKLI